MAVKDDYQDFKNALNDLKMNNKSLINFLTILAEDKIQNAPQIVRAIEERILETKGDYVLPSLYVLDSIVKNLRSPIYVQLIENKLPVIFASAFNKVDERTRLAMFKLRQTWPPYFSNTVLYNLDTRTHYIDPAWPITARVPDPSSSSSTSSVPNIHINPDFIQRNPTNTNASVNQQKLPANQDDTNNNRPVNQTNIKTSESSSSSSATRDDNYHMIPIDRKEQNRQEIEPNLSKDSNDNQQSKAKENENSSNEKSSIEKNDTTQNDEDVLFGGRDIDYRDTDITNQQKISAPPATTTTTTNQTNLDTDRLFKLNSECLSLAEQKFKSKELSSEEYQATLKLLQTILQDEIQRLTVPSTTTPSLLPAPNPSSITTSLTNPLPQQTLTFPANPTTAAGSLPTFPFAGFGNDTQRHALQILAAVNATSAYASSYNLFPYLPPLPPAPAPPPFSLVSNTFPTSTSTSTPPGRISPSIKRPHDDNSNHNIHSDNDAKRPRSDSPATSTVRSHNFDEENIALVPPLFDANINTLKKKYIGVIQQLYVGKYQCRVCGLRFTAKQKQLYTHHLDWHYWENRQAATNTTTALLERCRDWYPSLQEWTVYEENLHEKFKNNQLMLTQNRQAKDLDSNKTSTKFEIISCSAKSNGDTDDDRCYVCHDPFENFFDDNREEWCLKDAIRVDGKTYHPICYQDVQYHEANDKNPISSSNDPSALIDSMADETSNHSTDSQIVGNAIATVNIKSETDDINERDLSSSSSSSEDTTKPNYLSSMSFVNLVETIFVKKEDIKPIGKIENVTINVKDELLDPTTINEEIPFLSIKPENECEFLINKTSDGFGTISDQ